MYEYIFSHRVCVQCPSCILSSKTVRKETRTVQKVQDAVADKFRKDDKLRMTEEEDGGDEKNWQRNLGSRGDG